MAENEKDKKKKVDYGKAWIEAKALMWQYRGRLAVGFALMMINRIAGLALPGSSKYLVDTIIGETKYDMLVPLALGVGAATVIQGITTFALSQVISVAAQDAIMDMRRRVQSHVAHLPIAFFDATKSGTLISRIMTDPEGIRNLVGTGIIRLVGGVFTALLALAVLIYLNWQLTIVIFVVLLIFGGAMAYAFKTIRPIFRERNKIRSEVSGRLGETLSGIRIVKAYNVEEREEKVFSEGVDNLFLNIKKSITGISAISSFGTVVIGIVGVVMIIVGGRAMLSGEMTLGDFIMYIFFTGLLAAPVVQVANIGTQLSDAFAGLDRIHDIFQQPTDDANDEGKDPVGPVVGDIEFKDVWFEYNENEPVIQGISFKAKAGTTTALVGSSGSGKSTLVSLVMSFNQPQRGKILIDGRDLQSIKVGEYRRLLGVVLQENFLFDGTVEENISFTKPGATRDEVVEVGKIAHAHEFISEFSEGYDTIVGERGVKLSGGQRQRISIARALLADPKILILDEATSSLDSESEAMIQEGLTKLREGKTSFVIAHRLSTIRSADKILVIEEGRIAESGTHEELYQAKGRYRDLYDQQNRWEEDRFINPGEILESRS